MPGGMQLVLSIQMVTAANKCRAARWSWGVLMDAYIYLQLGQVLGVGGQL